MLVDDAPARVYRMSAELHDDPPHILGLRDYFEDVLDQLYPPDRMRGYGYPAASGDGEEQSGEAAGRSAARHGLPRRGSAGRARAAALTAAAVVGTGVSAGLFGIVPFLSPAATAPHVTAGAAAEPIVRTVSGPAAPARPHAGYTGKHRQPRPPAAAASSPSAAVAPRPPPRHPRRAAATRRPPRRREQGRASGRCRRPGAAAALPAPAPALALAPGPALAPGSPAEVTAWSVAWSVASPGLCTA